MSNEVFPTLPGIKIGTRRRTRWSTEVREAASGREYRAGNWVSPRGGLVLTFEFLRADVYTELQTLTGFFNRHRGSLFSWLFEDELDRTVSAQPLGLGDGVTATHQLVRTWGGFVSPVLEPNGMPAVLIDGVPLNGFASGAAFDAADWDGSAVVTANTFTSPAGGTDADTLADTLTGAQAYRHQAAAVADDDQPHTVSVYLRKTSGGTSPTARVLLRLSGGVTVDAELRVNSDTGAILAGAGQVQDQGSYWRLVVTAVNNATGNTMADYWVYPAWGPHGDPALNVATTGSAVFYGAKFERRTATAGPYTSRTYSLGAQGLVSISPAPALGTALTWSGNYRWRMRFASDDLDAEQMLTRLYQTGAIELKYAPEG